MKVVITGANSFIGRHLLKYLHQCGFDVTNELVCVTRTPFSQDECQFANVNLALHEYSKILDFIPTCDVFVHLAWYGTRGQSRNNFEEQSRACQESLDGIRLMLQSGCKKIITAGSQAEYGPSHGIITEDTVCKPNTWYGKKKLELYELTKRLCKQYGAQVIEPRFFSLYGTGDYAGTMIMSSIRKMKNNEDCDFTLSEQFWDYLNIKDAVRAMYSLIISKEAAGVYNFASGNCRPLRDFILEIKNTISSKSKLNFGAIPYPETGMVSMHPDVSKLKQLPWTAKITFAKGIKEISENLDK